MRDFNRQRGFTGMQAIIVITSLLAVIGLELTLLGVTETLVARGSAESAQTLAYAEAGARDALERIARDKTYTCASTDCYSLDMLAGGCASGEGCARMSVSAGIGTVPSPKIIISTGVIGNKTRKVRVDVVFDASLHGAIESATWSEVTN